MIVSTNLSQTADSGLGLVARRAFENACKCWSRGTIACGPFPVQSGRPCDCRADFPEVALTFCAVFELNFQAGPKEAQEDFENLDTIIAALDYPLGIFVNIDSARTHAASYQGAYRDRIHFFAVRLVDGAVQVKHAFYTADGLVER